MGGRTNKIKQDAIALLAKRNRKLVAEDIVDETGWAHGTVENALDEMVDAGLCEYYSKGDRYGLRVSEKVADAFVCLEDQLRIVEQESNDWRLRAQTLERQLAEVRRVANKE